MIFLDTNLIISVQKTIKLKYCSEMFRPFLLKIVYLIFVAFSKIISGFFFSNISLLFHHAFYTVEDQIIKTRLYCSIMLNNINSLNDEYLGELHKRILL